MSSDPDIIDLQKEREERTPHLSGSARCLSCQFTWIATAEVGVMWLQCPNPACMLMLGRFIEHCEREGDHWHCVCGNDVFFITPDGVYCPQCGTWQDHL